MDREEDPARSKCEHATCISLPPFAGLMRGDDTTLVAHQHRLLEARQNAAAQLGMHMYGFRVILKNTFATDDRDTVINQLVFRSQGHLQQFVEDRQAHRGLKIMMQIQDGFVFSGGSRPLDHLIATSGEIMCLLVSSLTVEG